MSLNQLVSAYDDSDEEDQSFEKTEDQSKEENSEEVVPENKKKEDRRKSHELEKNIDDMLSPMEDTGKYFVLRIQSTSNGFFFLKANYKLIKPAWMLKKTCVLDF